MHGLNIFLNNFLLHSFLLQLTSDFPSNDPLRKILNWMIRLGPDTKLRAFWTNNICDWLPFWSFGGGREDDPIDGKVAESITNLTSRTCLQTLRSELFSLLWMCLLFLSFRHSIIDNVITWTFIATLLKFLQIVKNTCCCQTNTN